MYGRESWGTDLASAAAAIAAGYLLSSAQKAASNPLMPLVGSAVVGAGAIGLTHLFQNPYAHEISEAVGYVGLGSVGQWIGEATTTIGNKGPGAAPVYLPKKASSSSAARIAAARAQAELARGGGQAAIVQPLQPQPGRPTQVYQYSNEDVA